MKSRKNTKIRIIFLVVAMGIMFALPITANAESTVQSYTYTGSFNEPWEGLKSGTYNGYTVYLRYGFDTFLINEDYAYAYTNGAIHRSRIVNGNGTHVGPWKVANDWSDKEVQHSGSSVSYYQTWQ